MIGKTPRISLLMPRLPACGRKHGKSRPTYLPHISLTPEGNFEKFQKCLRWAWANICPIWTAEGRVGHCSRAPLPSPRPAVAALPPWSKSQFSERGNWGEKELCLHSPPPPPLPGEWIRKRFESEKVMGLLGEALEGERGTRARQWTFRRTPAYSQALLFLNSHLDSWRSISVAASSFCFVFPSPTCQRRGNRSHKCDPVSPPTRFLRREQGKTLQGVIDNNWFLMPPFLFLFGEEIGGAREEETLAIFMSPCPSSWSEVKARKKRFPAIVSYFCHCRKKTRRLFLFSCFCTDRRKSQKKSKKKLFWPLLRRPMQRVEEARELSGDCPCKSSKCRVIPDGYERARTEGRKCLKPMFEDVEQSSKAEKSQCATNVTHVLQNIRKLVLYFIRKSMPPRRGIEPRSPAWQSGILTTILSRTGC